jgi:hypothetical protein
MSSADMLLILATDERGRPRHCVISQARPAQFSGNCHLSAKIGNNKIKIGPFLI